MNHSPPFPSTSHRPARQAFTIVEVLVVVAIVAILAALAFPALGTATAKARSSECQANLRQLGVGIQLFTSDNNGFLPPTRDDQQQFTAITNGGTSGAHWNQAISDYLGKKDAGVTEKYTEALGCPSWPDDPSYNPARTWIWGYGMNNNPLDDRSHSVWSDGAVRLSAITLPSKRVLLADSSDWHLSRSTRAPERHDSHANALFFDGHVEAINNATDLDLAIEDPASL